MNGASRRARSRKSCVAGMGSALRWRAVSLMAGILAANRHAPSCLQLGGRDEMEESAQVRGALNPENLSEPILGSDPLLDGGAEPFGARIREVKLLAAT